MNKIEEFVESIFEGIEMNAELMDQKEELILNMTDRFNELIESGKSIEEAYDSVINNFGSIDEIKEELNIPGEIQGIKSTKKVKIGIGVAIAIAVIILIQSTYKYYNNRYFDLSGDIEFINMEFNTLITNAAMSNREDYYRYKLDMGLMNNMQQHFSKLQRDLNWFEKRRYDKTENQFFLSFEIRNMIIKLSENKRMGYWDELDQEVYERLGGLMKAFQILLDEESFRISGIEDDGEHSSFRIFRILTASLDIEAISEGLRDFNELAACYMKYDELPENIDLLTEEDIENILREKLGNDDIVVEIPDYAQRNTKAYKCEYQLVRAIGDGFDITATVDAVNGSITYLVNHSRINSTESDFDYDDKIIKEKVQTMFDSEGNYSLEYKGLNYKIHSDRDYYSYVIIPKYYGYQVYSKIGEIVMQIATDNINGIRFNDHSILSSLSDIGELDINYDENEAIEYVFDTQLDYIINKFGINLAVSDFSYQKTALVKSFATGKYDLNHIYKHKDNGFELYIHTVNGMVE